MKRNGFTRKKVRTYQYIIITVSIPLTIFIIRSWCA